MHSHHCTRGARNRRPPGSGSSSAPMGSSWENRHRNSSHGTEAARRPRRMILFRNFRCSSASPMPFLRRTARARDGTRRRPDRVRQHGWLRAIGAGADMAGRAAVLAVSLEELGDDIASREGGPARELAEAWTAHRDLSSVIVLGDPAIRLARTSTSTPTTGAGTPLEPPIPREYLPHFAPA